MELPDVGQQCSELQCKQLDFLPLKCNCGSSFCSEHYTIHISNCVVVKGLPVAEVKVVTFVCSYPLCKSKSCVPLINQKDNKHYCILHRHAFECNDKTSEILAAELEKYNAPMKKFNCVKEQLDKEIYESINQAKKKTRTQQLANKVQLMRVKNKAIGLKTIPVNDRIYFSVQHPKSAGDNVSYVFVAKTWTLGKVIDAIADECKVVNKNNQYNAQKLNLFHKIGEIVSENMAMTMETLLSERLIMDGEELLLEYINKC